MQKKKSSYKEMLRDRISEMTAVDLALKWCKSKEKWINHVYTNFIAILPAKKERYFTTRVVLGISGKYRTFDFDKTIAWEDLSKQDREYWKTISSWISWFQDNMAYIEQDIRYGYNDSQIEQKFNIADYPGLVEHIRKSI